MSDIREKERMDELRHRLYERGFSAEESKHKLTPSEVEVSRGWNSVPGTIRQQDIVQKPVLSNQTQPNNPSTVDTSSVIDENENEIIIKPKRRYRSVILIASLIFFIGTVAVSSVYLFFGNNQISAKNIGLTLNAPFTVAGGEVTTLQVNITNQNSVPINSASLIVNYPSGTRSADTEARELYEEKIPVADIAPGQSVNLPLRAVLYGEENEVKQIKVSIEYRVEGSNARFSKELDPQNITISSAPLVALITGVDKISSGQDLTMTIKVQSNSTAIQKNILVSVSYPNSFSFDSAKPDPAYGKNSWLISELPGGQATEIVIKGKVAGLTNESGEVQVKVGNPELSNQFIMGSVFSQAKFSYLIEQPFTGVSVAINRDSDGSAVIDPEVNADVVVTIKNTLDKPIYDMRVMIKPTGNLIRDNLLRISGGYYDSDTKTIQYESSGKKSLAEVGPGETRDFSFSVLPDKKQGTASFTVNVNVYAKRITEGKPVETLIGTTLAEAKYYSKPSLERGLGYSNGPFTDTGAIPPVAGTPTTYTVTLKSTAGVNDMNAVAVTTSLPQYVTWLDKVDGDGKLEFNPISKQLRWNVGAVTANSSKVINFQVSLLPSVTQVGSDAIIIGEQELKATDSFTGTSLQVEQSGLSNELSTELGFPKGNGIIRKKD